MTVHLAAKKLSKHFIPNFELHSLLLFAALAIAAVSAAQAQTAAAASPYSPSVQITSSAGTIPPNQATSRPLDAAFNRADANRDGKLNRQEAEHFPALAHFEQIDSNHDSFLSRGEFNQAARD